MRENEGVYAVIIAVLIIASFIVPFTILSTIEKSYGSFLFWTIITIVVIGINYLLIKDWGRE